MEIQEVKNRVAEALSLRNMKAVELVEKSGVSKGALSSYMCQRWQPKQKALYNMARALDVSEMWLAGYDVPMERAPEQKRADELALLIHQLRSNQELCNLLKLISVLTPAQFKIVESLVNELVRSAPQQS